MPRSSLLASIEARILGRDDTDINYVIAKMNLGGRNS
jgi:hypothetical protein